MTTKLNGLCGLTALSLSVIGICLWPASGRALTEVETLYAELAKLPDAERQKKIEEGARKDGALVALNTTSGSKGAQHFAVFKKRYPFLKAERGDLSPETGGEQLTAEVRAGRYISDLISLALSDMGDVLKLGVAARYPTPVTKNVLPEYRGALDPEHRWVPWRISEQGISYNPKMLENLKLTPPKTYMDLCDPQYSGQVALDTVSTRVLTGFYNILGEEKTREFLDCIGKNSPIIMRGQTSRIMLMLAGDHAIQASNSLYVGVALNKENPAKAPFKAVYSAPIMIYPTGLIISSHSPHPYATALFVDWALSEESQEQITGWGRGNVTEKHPFFPPDAQLVTFGLLDEPVRKRLQDYYLKYIGQAR
jgi:iron(III) transport system substrate-binding protein